MWDRPPRSRYGRDRGPGPKIRILGPRDNGRTLPFGGKYLGSSPSPAANYTTPICATPSVAQIGVV